MDCTKCGNVLTPVGEGDVLFCAKCGNNKDKKPVENKYKKTIELGGIVLSIDVYDVLLAFNVTNPATAHAIKKLLMPGNRGYKSTVQDLQEAIVSIKRAIELEEKNG
jgi:predicted  nucleic acid-binding Zn-ribbon protein